MLLELAPVGWIFATLAFAVVLIVAIVASVRP